MWQTTLVSSTSIVLSYSDEIWVSFTCADFVPDVPSATIEYVGIAKEGGPTDGLFRIVQNLLQDMTKDKSLESLASVRILVRSKMVAGPR